MADNSRLELVVEVDVNKANASIKSINTGLSSMEQAAGNAARGASAGIDGMTASMIKGATAGNLLADAIKGALNWAKEWTIGAIQAAAAEDKMMASMVALAKANGVAASSAERAVEAVRKVGFHGDEAATAIGRLIIMDVSLAKARGLAIIAKDAAASATESISAADALGKITQALEFGNARALRSIGLKVDFTRALWVEENRLGRALTDNEAISLRLIEVEKAAVAIRGAGAAVSATAAGQQTKLAREVHELKEAIGAEFQGYLKAWVSTQRDLVAFLTENSSFLIKFGSGVLVLAGIIGTITAATKLWALAQGAANLAMVANPAGLLAVGVTGAAVVGYSAYRQMQEDQQQQFAASRQQQLRTMAAAPGGIAQLRRQGVSDADLREAFAGRKRNLAWGTEDAPEDAADMPWAKVPKLNLEGGPDLDALKLAAEIRKKQGENERFFAGRAIAAGSVGKTGFAKDAVEMSADIAGRTSFVDERGVAHQVALTQRAMASIIEEARLKFDAYEVHVAESNRKVTADDEKAWRALSEKRIEWDGQLFAQRLKHDQEASEKAYEHAQTLYGFEEQRAGFARDADLRVAEAVEPRTLQAKVELERRKTEIEIGYLEKVHAVKQHLYDIDTVRVLMEEELTLKRLGYKADEVIARMNELTQQRQDIRDQAAEAVTAGVDSAALKGAVAARKLVTDQIQGIFQTLKQEAGGVFDALVTKSQSVWAALGNSLKTALLTAIKDVVTSKIAAMLTVLVTGQNPVQGGGGMLSGGAMIRSLMASGASRMLFGRGSGDGGVLADMPMPAEGMMDSAVAGWRWNRREAAKDEYARIQRADSGGMTDAGATVTSAALAIADLHPVFRLAMRAMKLVGDPSLKQLTEVARSFSFEEGGGPGGAQTAIMPPMAFKAARGGALNVPSFGSVAAAEKWAAEALGVKASLGTDLALAQTTVRGLADTVNRGGVIAPRVKIDVRDFPQGGSGALAHYSPGLKAIVVNPAAPYWGQTAENQADRFMNRWSSSRNENATFFHESGHYAHDYNLNYLKNKGDRSTDWVRNNEWKTDVSGFSWNTDIAKGVSAYAAKSPKEFVAEVYAGKLDGRSYSREVEELYRKMAGPEVRLTNRGFAGSGAGSSTRGGTMFDEPDYTLFRTAAGNRTAEQMAARKKAVSAKGGRRSVLYEADRRAAAEAQAAYEARMASYLDPDSRAAIKAADKALERSTAMYEGPEVNPPGWGSRDMQILDELFPWLKGAEKTKGARILRRPSDIGKLPDMPFEAWDGGYSPAPWGAPGGFSQILGLGGTGGFAGGYGGTGGATGTGGSRWASIPGNLKNFKWGGLTHAPERWTLGEDGILKRGTVDAQGNINKGGGVTGVSGAAGAAMFAGGMMLAQRGLLGADRGTWLGVGEGAAGGAMVGFQMGGPLGAVIGAIVGAGIGIGEKLAGVETPEREAARLIKSIYGINISASSGTIKQVVAIAKQSYGGSVSVAVRSKEVRDLVQLHADSTGQKSNLFAGSVHSASLIQRGGSLYQGATYYNGSPYTFQSSLATLGPSGGTLPTGDPFRGGTSIHLDAQQTVDLWRTGTTLAIAGNPRGVAQATVAGAGQSSARLNSAVISMSPTMVLA